MSIRRSRTEIAADAARRLRSAGKRPSSERLGATHAWPNAAQRPGNRIPIHQLTLEQQENALSNLNPRRDKRGVNELLGDFLGQWFEGPLWQPRGKWPAPTRFRHLSDRDARLHKHYLNGIATAIDLALLIARIPAVRNWLRNRSFRPLVRSTSTPKRRMSGVVLLCANRAWEGWPTLSWSRRGGIRILRDAREWAKTPDDVQRHLLHGLACIDFRLLPEVTRRDFEFRLCPRGRSAEAEEEYAELMAGLILPRSWWQRKQNRFGDGRAAQKERRAFVERQHASYWS